MLFFMFPLSLFHKRLSHFLLFVSISQALGIISQVLGIEIKPWELNSKAWEIELVYTKVVILMQKSNQSYIEK